MYLGTPTAAPWLLKLFPEVASCVAEWEAHCVLAIPHPGLPGVTAVVATGAGDRGAIFAAYELSHQLLGVSPWWWWTGREPRYREQVRCVPPRHSHSSI